MSTANPTRRSFLRAAGLGAAAVALPAAIARAAAPPACSPLAEALPPGIRHHLSVAASALQIASDALDRAIDQPAAEFANTMEKDSCYYGSWMMAALARAFRRHVAPADTPLVARVRAHKNRRRRNPYHPHIWQTAIEGIQTALIAFALVERELRPVSAHYNASDKRTFVNELDELVHATLGAMVPYAMMTEHGTWHSFKPAEVLAEYEAADA